LIRHIVFFKLKENTLSNKEELKQKLLSLKENIKEVQFLEVGLNFSESERAYDVSLVVDFKSKEDLEIYAKDSYHQEVISFIKEKTTETKVVDYEN